MSLKTAWFMRMRVCEALALEVTVFTTGPDDAVQVDEAFLPESFSGNHANCPGFDPWRAPRRRGGRPREKEVLLTVLTVELYSFIGQGIPGMSVPRSSPSI